MQGFYHNSCLRNAAMQHSYEQVGISFPRNILLKIDHDRGDISRSRYVLRLIEHTSIYSISKDRWTNSNCVCDYRPEEFKNRIINVHEKNKVQVYDVLR